MNYGPDADIFERDKAFLLAHKGFARYTMRTFSADIIILLPFRWRFDQMCRLIGSIRSIFRFQKACVKYGVPDVDLFQAVDLMERKNISQVTNTIFAIGRTVIDRVCRYYIFLLSRLIFGILKIWVKSESSLMSSDIRDINIPTFPTGRVRNKRLLSCNGYTVSLICT